MVKKIILLGVCILGIFSSTQAVASRNHVQGAEIRTDELKTWYEQGKEMVVIDARSKKHYDKRTLPHAIWLPYDTSDKNIRKTLPSKTALIVVYCWSATCSASDMMADRLISNGYKNVYTYPGGLSEWMAHDFPIDQK